MRILTKTELPPTQEEYFRFYHDRDFDEELDRRKPTDTDIENILAELRLAYSKYENKRRIEVMANVLKMGLKNAKHDEFVQQVQDTLL